MGEVVKISRVEKCQGAIAIPSDKSLTHRAYIFAALAQASDRGGVSRLSNTLRGEDCEATRNAFAMMGKSSRHLSDTETELDCSGDWNNEPVAIDCGNSGTTMRLLAGVFAGLPGCNVTLTGDESLSRRPMKRIIDPLRMMGADISGDTAPITIRGKQLRGIHFTSPVASAQVKSCLLLAGLNATAPVSITEPAQSRNHTELMLQSLGVELDQDGLTTTLTPGQKWEPFSFRVPGDISSAAFWMVLAALVPGSNLLLQRVGLNPTRTGILGVFEQVGQTVEIGNQTDELGEAVGDVSLSYKVNLQPFEISGDLVPRLIDEIAVLAVLATQCHGKSIIRDAGEMRVKESDRIAVVCDALKRMGANVTEQPDGMIIEGPTPLTGTSIDARHDHRLAMSFAVAGSIADGETTILNADSVQTSYPEFWSHYANVTTP
ncbi:MAG: 3-phosphoshikimate 1-carboxyvinyltransferase [Armatimonadetes bacterium]|nr:3-phosphoshikimate 1-carboxyvinyltransferase [Armatimonadota bacterium]